MANAVRANLPVLQRAVCFHLVHIAMAAGAHT